MLRFTLALLPALVLFAMQKPNLSLIAYIVLGQGHFLLTYLYQWRAGKINRNYCILYIPIAIAVFAFAVYAPFAALLVATASIFSIHYFYDEARLLAKEDITISLSAILPPILFFVSYLLYETYGLDYFIPAIGVGITALSYAYFTHRASIFSQPYVLALNTIGLLILGIYFFGITVASTVLLGAIIIHHYGTWYIHQYVKLRSNLPRLAQYTQDVISVNFALAMLFIIYIQTSFALALEYLFEPKYFYAWTLLHIIFTSQQLLKAGQHRLARFGI